MIKERRTLIKEDPKLGESGDLLSIMIQDPLFENNDDQIVNESLTFFLAGTLTQATTIANTICFMIQNSQVEHKIRDSLSANFNSFTDKSASLEDLANELTIDKLDLMQDEYLKYCIYESLRIDPPVPISTSFTVTEDIEIGGVKV
jgi:cytochrome P450